MTDYERGFRAGVEAAAKFLEDPENVVGRFKWDVVAALRNLRSLAPDAQPRGEGALLSCVHGRGYGWLCPVCQPAPPASGAVTVESLYASFREPDSGAPRCAEPDCYGGEIRNPVTGAFRPCPVCDGRKP